MVIIVENITSKDNKWVKEYRKLGISRQHRELKQCFIIEGVKLILEAFNNNVEFEVVFVTEACTRKREQELEKLFQAENCVCVSDEVANKMKTVETTQGLFAICKFIPKLLNLQRVKAGGLYVMLDKLQDSGNVGTIIRTAEAVGIDGIIVTKGTCDLYNLKVLRASMGSLFRMKILVVDTAIDTINSLNADGVRTFAAVVEKGAKLLQTVKFSGTCVLLLGNEGGGLDTEISLACSERVTIKMNGNAESLNVSMAACIFMWEMTKILTGVLNDE